MQCQRWNWHRLKINQSFCQQLNLTNSSSFILYPYFLILILILHPYFHILFCLISVCHKVNCFAGFDINNHIKLPILAHSMTEFDCSRSDNHETNMKISQIICVVMIFAFTSNGSALSEYQLLSASFIMNLTLY